MAGIETVLVDKRSMIVHRRSPLGRPIAVSIQEKQRRQYVSRQAWVAKRVDDVRQQIREALDGNVRLTANLAIENVSKHFPMIAGQALHLKLLDRKEICGTRVDLNPGQKNIDFEILQISRLAH